MIKKNIFAGIFIFLFGVIISIIIDDSLRTIIQHLYRTLTNDSIYFFGKSLYLFPNPLQVLAIGFWIFVFWKNNLTLNLKQKIINGFWVIGLFTITLILLIFIDGNLKVMQCTMCDDGRVGISHSDINYGVLIFLSLLVSVLPTWIKGMIKSRKKLLQYGDVLDLEIEKL